ncbi:MAG: dipeptide ABC transporter ATP-binding protein [Chloroflexi bacterium]|nr:MAG: dipeptide ABC transporter ATP-binding protein [Chloroflexota bacterium]
MIPALSVEDLTVKYRNGPGPVTAVREVSLEIQPGEVHGLVGESGSGKTTLALAVMRHLPEQAVITSGSIRVDGQELIGLSPERLRPIWGSQIAMVPQDPLSALNPTLRIGKQLSERFEALSRSDARDKAIELLEMVQIADPARVARSYPHQISGGMQQRVMIAMALSAEPKLLILDEPTTGLDSTTEAVVLDLIRELMRARQTATLYVSHSLGVIAQFADRLTVLYASELVEHGSKMDLFENPLHPYTCGLLDSVPRLGENKREIQLRSIEGRIPSLEDLPSACVFAPRCPVVIDICQETRPALEGAGATRQVRCYRWEETRAGEIDPRQPPAPPPLERPTIAETALQIENLEVRYDQPRSLAEWLRRSPRQSVRAVDNVRLTIRKGETLGLVGESGSGKTSLAQAVVGLVDSARGRVELFGAELPTQIKHRDRETLSRLQMVMQNPDEALNPYLTVGQSLSRPLALLRGIHSEEEVRRLLEGVRLPPEYADRYPAQLSAGEKQRVAIARAFAAMPGLVLLDEPVSSLDVSVQASILNLLNRLQTEHGTSLLFISHDISVVGYLSETVGVLYLGQLMELAPSENLFDPPYHPYTEALLSAIPLLDPKATQERVRLRGGIPSSLEPPSGCPFHTRCPRFIGDICIEQTPPWQEDKTGKRIFCHIPVSDLRREQGQVFAMRKRE